MKIKTIGATLAVTLAMWGIGLLVGTSEALGGAVPRISPPNSDAYGKTLAEWKGEWLRWMLVGSFPNGGMVGNVQLMPLPTEDDYVSGSGTPEDPVVSTGKLDVALGPGTPFVLNYGANWRQQYEDGSIDPPMADAIWLGDIQLLITIDGKTVISPNNEADFYIPETPFTPIVEYPTPGPDGAVAALSYQGFCFCKSTTPAGKACNLLPYHVEHPCWCPAWAGKRFGHRSHGSFERHCVSKVTGQSPARRR